MASAAARAYNGVLGVEPQAGSRGRARVVHGLDPSMDWIGLDWVEIFKNVRGLDWFGSETQNIIFEQVNKFNCITVLLLNRNRETDKSCSLHTYIVT